MGDQQRRAAFIHYVEHILPGGRGVLREKLLIGSSAISHYFNENKPFGEKVANKIAAKLRLPAGYFDRPIGEAALAPATTVPLEEQNLLVAYWERLTKAQRTTLMLEIQARAASNAEIAEHYRESGLFGPDKAVPQIIQFEDYTGRDRRRKRQADGKGD